MEKSHNLTDRFLMYLQTGVAKQHLKNLYKGHGHGM